MATGRWSYGRGWRGKRKLREALSSTSDYAEVVPHIAPAGDFSRKSFRDLSTILYYGEKFPLCLLNRVDM